MDMKCEVVSNARQQGSTPEDAATAAGLYTKKLRNAVPR